MTKSPEKRFLSAILGYKKILYRSVNIFYNIISIYKVMKTLIDIESGKPVRILKIAGGKRVRQHLQCLGIHTGDIVTLKKNSFLGGPILLEINGYDVAIGKGVASKIEVEEIE